MTRTLRARKPRPDAPKPDDHSESEAETKPRRKRTKLSQPPQPGDDDSTFANTAGPSMSASRKAPKKTTGKPKKAGKLAQLPNMPLDILFEIFGSLPPLDLLRLTRTNKTLRGLLMSRTSRSTWVEALAAVPDCPPVPEDITEPAWVHLAFEQACHTCGANGVRNAFWACRLRTCAKCLDNHPALITFDEAFTLAATDGFALRTALPWESGFGKYRHKIFTLRTEFTAVEAVLKTLPAGSPERSTYVEEQKTKADVMTEFAARCQEWDRSRVSQRSDDLEAARQRRRAAIRARLADMDDEYDKDFDWLSSRGGEGYQLKMAFDDMKSVKQPKDLTDRMWANCQKEVIEFMTTIRPLRKTDKWLAVLKRRVTILGALLLDRSPDSMEPICIMDVYTRLDFRVVLERPCDDDDIDTVEVEDFSDALADWDGVVAHARASRRTKLLEALRKVPEQSQATEKDLGRLTSLFRCTDSACAMGNRVMNAAMATIHRCQPHPWASSINYPTSMSEWVKTDPLELMRIVCSRSDVSGGRGTFEVEMVARERAVKVIHLAGVDPQTVTAADLDEMDPWFMCTCTTCRGATYLFGTSRRLFDWRHAIEHNHLRHPTKLDLLDDGEDKTWAKEQREKFIPALNTGVATTASMWACMHCERSMMNNKTLIKHLEDAHDVTQDAKLHTNFQSCSDCLAPPTGDYRRESKHTELPWDEYDSDDDYYMGGWGIFHGYDSDDGW